MKILPLALPICVTCLLISPNIYSQSLQEKAQQAKERVGDSTTFVNTVEKPPRVKPPKPLRKEWAMGFKYNTDGYGLWYRFGKIKHLDGYNNQDADKYFDNQFWEIEINEKKNSKEYYSEVGNFGELGGGSWFTSFFGKTFIIGKMYNFYQVKLGYGYKKMIAGKGEPGAVSIHWVYSGGLSIGILKPYIFKSGGEGWLGSDYTTPKDENLLNPYNISGAYGITKGWSNGVKIKPGLHLKTALNFDYSSKKSRVAAIEIGANVEAYASKIPIMMYEKPQQFFFNLYGALSFGKRKQ